MPNRVKNQTALSEYMREIQEIALLTPEQQKVLARRAAEGDRAAKEALIRANLRFVVSVARKYQHTEIPLEDLISEGNIGLIQAVEHFDVNRGYQFITYAVWWIRQGILKTICENTRMIRLPMNRINELNRIKSFCAERQCLTGQTPNPDEIAAQLQMNRTQVTRLLQSIDPLLSLDTAVGQADELTPLCEFIEGNDRSAHDQLVSASIKTDIEGILGTLSVREAEVIRHRFGLDDREPLTLKQIGDRYRVTKERIRQIEKRAMRKLRKSQRKELLEAYVRE